MICQCNVRVRVRVSSTSSSLLISSVGCFRFCGGGRGGHVEREEIKPRGWMEDGIQSSFLSFSFSFSFRLMRSFSPRDCKVKIGRRNYVAVSGDAATVVSSLKGWGRCCCLVNEFD